MKSQPTTNETTEKFAEITLTNHEQESDYEEEPSRQDAIISFEPEADLIRWSDVMQGENESCNYPQPDEPDEILSTTAEPENCENVKNEIVPKPEGTPVGHHKQSKKGNRVVFRKNNHMYRSNGPSVGSRNQSIRQIQHLPSGRGRMQAWRAGNIRPSHVSSQPKLQSILKTSRTRNNVIQYLPGPSCTRCGDGHLTNQCKVIYSRPIEEMKKQPISIKQEKMFESSMSQKCSCCRHDNRRVSIREDNLFAGQLQQVACDSLYESLDTLVQKYPNVTVEILNKVQRTMHKHIRGTGEMDFYKCSNLPKGSPLRNFAEFIKLPNEDSDTIYVATHYNFNEISMETLFSALTPENCVQRISRREMTFATRPRKSDQTLKKTKPLAIYLNCDTNHFAMADAHHNFHLKLRNSRLFFESQKTRFPLPNGMKLDTCRLSTNRLFMALDKLKAPCMFLVNMVLRMVWVQLISEEIPQLLMPDPSLCCENIRCNGCSNLVVEARRIN